MGQELTGASLALAHDGVSADGRRDGEGHDDGDRSQQVHRKRVGGLCLRGVAFDVLLDGPGQGVDDVADLRDELVARRTADDAEQHPGMTTKNSPARMIIGTQ